MSGIYGITTAWGRAEPGKGAFLDAWFQVLNAIRGRWGKNEWECVAGPGAGLPLVGLYRLVAGSCSFGVYIPGVHATLTFKLPQPPSSDSVIRVESIDALGVSTSYIKPILTGDTSVSLVLSGDVVFVSASYETERR